MYDQMITLAMVIAAHGPNCNVCDQVVDLLTDEPGLGPSLDHVIPRSRGGRHTLDNLRVCHHRCNSFKRDRALSEVRGQAPATGGDEVAPRLF